VAVVISLKLVYTPVDATVTAIRNYQVPSTKGTADPWREQRNQLSSQSESRHAVLRQK